ncbi:MAG: FHA domain-containing protein [Hyphomicrobiaceae bacterium]|nr:FHA domain-containing protein [Hyphomicrobiaceae bacterium]
MSGISELLSDMASMLAAVAGISVTHAPTLAIGLAGLALVPALVAVGWLMRRKAPDDVAATRRYRPTGGTPSSSASTEAGPATMAWHRPARPARTTSLVVVGDGPQKGTRFIVSSRAMTRIGRESDNEICLEDATVHRYHAVIRRSPEEGLVLTDLSGADGNGIAHNGRRVPQAHLADGDTIVLGKITLRVETT